MNVMYLNVRLLLKRANSYRQVPSIKLNETSRLYGRVQSSQDLVLATLDVGDLHWHIKEN